MEGAAMAAARRMAESAPETEVACPVCANTMKGASLAKHLAGKHAGVDALPTRWEGADHASQSIALWLGITSVAIVAAGVAVVPEGFRIVVDVALVVLLAAMGLGVASFAGKLPGTLELKGDVLELTTFFGLRTRRLHLPPNAIEVGQLRIVTESPVGGASYHERRLGSYVRLTGDGDTLVLGAPKGTNMAKRWDRVRFTHGPKRQYWHLGLDRAALVAIEYQLAARGALSPRA